jgi:hypothetical protein
MADGLMGRGDEAYRSVLGARCRRGEEFCGGEGAHGCFVGGYLRAGSRHQLAAGNQNLLPNFSDKLCLSKILKLTLLPEHSSLCFFLTMTIAD